MCSAIVLSTDKYNYRKVVQEHYGLTDEQMKKHCQFHKWSRKKISKGLDEN
jgi:hypothetical protein